MSNGLKNWLPLPGFWGRGLAEYERMAKQEETLMNDEIELHICDPATCELCQAIAAYHPGIPNTWNPPVLTPPARQCDCGARVAKTTHAHWCATCKP